MNKHKLLSYQQLIYLYNLNRYEYPTRESVLRELEKRRLEKLGHLFIKENR